jgi:hypothetical protein
MQQDTLSGGLLILACPAVALELDNTSASRLRLQPDPSGTNSMST